MNDWAGPWCTTAVICQRTESEPGTLVRTLSGLLTKITIPAGSEKERRAILTMSFIRGDADGPQHLRVVGRLPDGKSPVLIDAPFEFEPDYIGINVDVVVDIPLDLPGVVWMDISINDRLLTRTAVRVIYSHLPD